MFAELERSGGYEADTILFMTWGRRDGLLDAGHRDFEAMQVQLHSGSMGIADELDAMVAPVGIAWQNAIARSTAGPLAGRW